MRARIVSASVGVKSSTAIAGHCTCAALSESDEFSSAILDTMFPFAIE